MTFLRRRGLGFSIILISCSSVLSCGSVVQAGFTPSNSSGFSAIAIPQGEKSGVYDSSNGAFYVSTLGFLDMKSQLSLTSIQPDLTSTTITLQPGLGMFASGSPSSVLLGSGDLAIAAGREVVVVEPSTGTIRSDWQVPDAVAPESIDSGAGEIAAIGESDTGLVMLMTGYPNLIAVNNNTWSIKTPLPVQAWGKGASIAALPDHSLLIKGFVGTRDSARLAAAQVTPALDSAKLLSDADYCSAFSSGLGCLFDGGKTVGVVGGQSTSLLGAIQLDGYAIQTFAGDGHGNIWLWRQDGALNGVERVSVTDAGTSEFQFPFKKIPLPEGLPSQPRLKGATASSTPAPKLATLDPNVVQLVPAGSRGILVLLFAGGGGSDNSYAGSYYLPLT